MLLTRVMTWTCLRGALLALASLGPPRPPLLLGCVFRNRANVTCSWEPGHHRHGDHWPPSAANYTLTIKKMSGGHNGSLISSFTCTTVHASCTVRLHNNSVASTFCVGLAVHTPHGHAHAAPRCQSGRREVMLVPVRVSSVEAVSSRPRCLRLSWERPATYVVSPGEVTRGKLLSQIQYATDGQPGGSIADVNVTGTNFTACPFRAATRYGVQLRHRYLGNASPWSPWSNRGYATTAEDAPSAAPAFWRRVSRTNQNASRHVVLLWKPLHHSLANGKVLSYSVMCHSDNTRVHINNSGCGVVPHTRTSCHVLLPPGGHSCFLTASNSAGTSPVARLYLLDRADAEGPPPSHVAVSPLDDSSLEVGWTAPDTQPLSGFVVESRLALVIAEGVEPMVLYAVAVSVLYGEHGSGRSTILHMYTRQGAPSAGPKVIVQSISGDRVELSWSPLPVQQQRGYIRNYTIHYTHADGHAGRVHVSADVYQCSLTNLPPGNYDLYIQASTDAGVGVAGPLSNVNIGPAEVPLSSTLVACGGLVAVSTALVAMLACLSRTDIVKQKLCEDIPNPSKSSLAHWTPQSRLQSNHLYMKTPDVLYSEVTSMDVDAADGLGDAGGVQVLSCATVCPHHAADPSGAHTHCVHTSLLCPGDQRTQEKEGSRSTSTSSPEGLLVCDYSQIHTAPPGLPGNIQPRPDPQITDTPRAPGGCSAGGLPLGGDMGPCPLADGLEISFLGMKPSLLPPSVLFELTRRSFAVSESLTPSIHVLDPLSGPFSLPPVSYDEPYI